MHQKDRPGIIEDAELEPLVNLFYFLSDKTRVKILTLLAQGERNVTAICKELRLSQPTVSHHLGLLRMTNLVKKRRSGKQIFYALNGQVEPAGERGLQFEAGCFGVRISRPLQGSGED